MGRTRVVPFGDLSLGGDLPPCVHQTV